ncbi:hypothetical protein [Psychrobacillus sp. FSL K6-1267]|uniref:hypothetical protein n=1 Tax=Psychrobacillus sp. FSL K6-1267 TaxID=2921543 RepID=UPI0030F8EB80
MIHMEDYKFAELDSEQLQELSELEERLGVTLIAYNAALHEPTIISDQSSPIT